uniref:hypothetical protein n=1 Tax=Methanobrevibacter sp. TaxID=66852 RepID=UPI00388D2012
MIKKRYMILVLCIITLLSIQFVSANDNADDITVLGASEDMDILQAPTETKSYTDLNNTINGNLDNEISLEYNYNYQNGDPRTGINITRNLVINGNGAVIDGASLSSLFNISSGVTVTLKNLTITHAAGISDDGQEWYRAITAGSETSLNIVDCTFDSNQAGREWQFGGTEFVGSAIYSLGNVNIQNSNFTNNVVQTAGVIYTTGTLTAKNTNFSNNRAINRQQDNTDGGAIFASYVDFIENCTFKSNFADVGGSIYLINGIGRISDSTFDGTGVNQGYNQMVINGAAITTLWGAINLIENSTFTDFTSVTDGGAIYMMSLSGTATTTIINSTFKRNSASSNVQGDTCLGGAIYTPGNLEIENVVMEDNAAVKGGVFYAGGTVTISDSRPINNNGRLIVHPVTVNGGVIYAKGDVVINNTDFGYNYATVAGGAIYSEGNVNFYNSKVDGSADTTDGNGDGGFIYAKGNVEIENSTIEAVYMKVAEQGHQFSGAVFTEKNIVVKNSNFTKTNKMHSSIGGAIRALGNAEIYNSNFTHNKAVQYGALYVDGTLDVYDSYFYNNTNSVAFAEQRAIVNNTQFVNNTCNAENINGRILGSNSTLNITNSVIDGTRSTGSQFKGSVFADGDVFVDNCNFTDS